MILVATMATAKKECYIIDFECFKEGSTVTAVEALNLHDKSTLTIDVGSISFAKKKDFEKAKYKASAMIFDSTCEGGCSGGDTDLKFPEQGKTLILSEDFDAKDPDDNFAGGWFLFGFPSPVQEISFDALDFDEGGIAWVQTKHGKWKKQKIPKSGDNEAQTVSFNVKAVTTLKIITFGSGAIDDINFCVDSIYDCDTKKEVVPPTTAIPPIRDERTVKDLALFIQGKNLRTTKSATIPNLDTATAVYDAVLGGTSLEDMREFVAANTRDGGRLVELTTKWLQVSELNLPPITEFAMYPTVNTTSFCSMMEMIEIYLNAYVLNIPFDKIEAEISDEIKLLDDIVAAHPDEFTACLKDHVITKWKGNRPKYTIDTFLHRENFPGVLDGPFVSQFWSMPYLLQQSHQALAGEIFVEDFRQGTTGTMLSYLKTQTAALFTRQISGRRTNPSEFSYHATAVHSDALMSFSVKQLDLLLTSTLHRYECSEFLDTTGELKTLQVDFVTCSGCMAFYNQFYAGTQYALLGAFTAKKKFNRIRPEQFAYLIARATEKEGDKSSCLNIDVDACMKDGVLTKETCYRAAKGEIFSADDIAKTAPFFSAMLQDKSVATLLKKIKARQDGCLLLNMLYPEGGPPHDAFPGGHSVYAGAEASLLGGMFCMYDDEKICTHSRFDESKGEPKLKKWVDVKFYNTGRVGEPNGVTGLSTDDLKTLLKPIGSLYEGNLAAGDVKEFTWKPTPEGFKAAPDDGITVWSELVKYAVQYTHARDRSGVHYYADGCSGMLLGELMSIRYLISNLQLRPSTNVLTEEETIVKPLFDGRHVILTRQGARLWGSTEPPSLDVNFLVESSSFGCASPLGPIRLDEALDGRLPESFGSHNVGSDKSEL